MSDQIAISSASDIPLQVLQQQAAPLKQETKATPPPTEDTTQEVPSEEEFETAVAELSNLVKPLSIGLNVQRVESLDRYYVELFDRDTGEVIREIPSKKIIELQENLRQFQGLMFDQFS